MSEMINEVRIGHQVPDFQLNCYDPQSHDFKPVTLAEQKDAGKWTVLFFYPADFTFV
jgi:alkyl hydroperoxide reductase subunit AhpC